jgi:hypothetical protein
MSIKDLFGKELKVMNIGSPSFTEDFNKQAMPFVHLDWRPPAGGDQALIKALDIIERHKTKIQAANDEVLNTIKTAQAKLIGVKQAINVIPGMTKTTILHAGPPVAWEDMAGPMKGAIMGALVYEGLANDLNEAEALAASGKITFDSAHNHNAVGPMAGIISPSMPVHVIHNSNHDNYAFCTINEGLGKVLRYGANNDEVLNRLRWLEKTFMPVMDAALKINGGVDVRSLVAQALHMGDECHNRNKASSSLFLREIVADLVATDFSLEEKQSVINFIKNNDHYFLNLSMPFCKVSLDSGRNVKYSSVVIAMARNGFEFGIQVSGLDKWYTAPANYVQGLLFPGFTIDDAAPDIGDSAITETMGIGGFAMGGAPAIVQFVGGEVNDAFNYSIQMNEITHSQNPTFTLPTLDFRPTACGIDILKVIESGILPIINTGMAHKEPGVGQVGAGLVSPPMECFVKAIKDFAEMLEKED